MLLDALAKIRISDLIRMAWVLAFYLVAAYLGLHFNSVNTFAAPIWIPTGIALAALVLGGYRLWPAIALGAFLINILFGAPLIGALGIAIGNTLEALAGAYLLLRFCGVEETFRSLRKVFIFIACVSLASIVSATIGVLSLWLVGTTALAAIPITWLAWALGDALGALVVTSFLLTWFIPYQYPVGLPRQHVVETLLLCAAIVGANLLSFVRPAYIPETMPLLYLTVLPLTWAAIRYGPRGATSAIAANLGIAVAATAFGFGPFAHVSYTQGLLFLQLYIGAISVTFLSFAAIVKEHKHTGDMLIEHVHKLEYALNKINSEDRAKTEFLAVLAHELRNPLAPVLSALELIKLKGLDSKDSMQAVAIMDKQIKNATGLLDDLLDISRISERKVVLNREILDIRTVIAHAIISTTPIMKTYQHSVTVSPSDEPLLVNGDALRLEQVMVNLLNNAAKYTNPGGMIVVGATQTKHGVTVRVRDNGTGIAPQMLTQIFEPFLQVARDGGKRTSGLGIGLSLVKKLVELHDGAITAQSEGLGRGSEFIVELPRSTSVALSDKEKEIPQKKKVSGVAKPTDHKILIVDDNELAAEGLGKLFKHLGYEVRLAFDGDTALAVAEIYAPTVIILDIGLPDRDGYEIAREIRRTLARQPILIAVTGYGQADDKAKAKLAGFDYHLTKPVGIKDFNPILNTIKKKK